MILYEYIDDNLLEESEEEKQDQDSVASDDSTEGTEALEETKEVLSEDDKLDEIEDSKEDLSKDSSVKEEKDIASEDDKSDDSKGEAVESDEEVSKEINFPHLIGKKIGMTQLFLDDGNSLPATILEVGPCSITQIKKESTEGYSSIQLSFKELKKNKANKSQLGHFSKSKVSPKKYLKEFRCKEKNDFKLGDVVTLKQFDLGDFVKVTGTSKGKEGKVIRIIQSITNNTSFFINFKFIKWLIMNSCSNPR